LYRDLYAQRNYITTYITNYSLIYPLLSLFSCGYLQANILFGGSALQTTSLIIGSILLPMMVLTYKNNIKLLFDLNNDRFIDYQISLMSPRLVLVERIVFTALLTFCLTLPFFPMAKLVLQNKFEVSKISFAGVIIMLLLSSLTCS